MALTAFTAHPNNISVRLGQAYTAGSGSLVVASGKGALFGSTFPMRVTVVTASTRGSSSETYTIFNVTGISTDTLTVSAAVEGTSDQNFSAGDWVEVRWTNQDAVDIEQAVNYVEALKSAYTFNTGNYYFTYPTGTTSTGLASVGTMRAGPFIVTSNITVVRIGAEVTVTGDSGSKVRLGIYADNGSGQPTTRLVDAGVIAGDSATVQELTISQALTPGLYWVAAVGQVISTTAPTIRLSTGGIFQFGTSVIPLANETRLGWYQASVTGALPNPFVPAGLTSSIPRTFVKV